MNWENWSKPSSANSCSHSNPHIAQIKYSLAQTNLKLAKQTDEADRALRDAGRKTQTELLNSMKALEDAQLAVERSQTDYLLAEIELKNLMGIPFYSGSTP